MPIQGSEWGVTQIFLGVLAVVAAAVVAYRLAVALRQWFRYRGQRLVICPETQRPAAVEVNALRAAEKALLGGKQLRLQDCSRWPERAGCGEDCLSQVQADPAACLVWNVVNAWYAGKSCAICKRPFGPIRWHDHPPALLDANHVTVQWTEVPPEKLPEVFATHWPVCWDCHVAESFRREHADLVTDRLPH